MMVANLAGEIGDSRAREKFHALHEGKRWRTGGDSRVAAGLRAVAGAERNHD